MDPWTRAAIEHHRDWLTPYLLAATGDYAAAEDLVQEVFQLAYEKRSAFEPGTNFGGWLRAIAKNCLKRHFDRTHRQPLLVGNALLELDRAASEAKQLSDPDWMARRAAALGECFGRLTRRAQEILDRLYCEGISPQEVALAFGMTRPAVNVASFRAREILADCVKRKMTP